MEWLPFGNTGAFITGADANNSAGIIGGRATCNETWATYSGGSLFPLATFTTLPANANANTPNVNYISPGGVTLGGNVSANSLSLSGGTLALGSHNLTFSGTSGGLLMTAGATINGTGYIGAGAANEFIVYALPSDPALLRSSPRRSSEPEPAPRVALPWAVSTTLSCCSPRIILTPATPRLMAANWSLTKAAVWLRVRRSKSMPAAGWTSVALAPSKAMLRRLVFLGELRRH